MNTPIKLTNPLSDKPTEMWMQAIADFEVVLTTPGYDIDMSYWCFPRKDEGCMVCMAGASMVRRSQGLPDEVFLDLFSERDAAKFESINSMREGHFKRAINWLALSKREEDKWLDAIQAADLKGPRLSLCSVHLRKDWPLLIKLLRESIAHIDTEYDRLSK